jgi:hypothetical protein
MISNPTRLAGYFYDSHHSDQENWQTLGFDSEESPIVDEAYVKRIETKHGRDSDEFLIRVKGTFPNVEGIDDQGYVPLLTEADLRPATHTALRGRIKFGIDPAGDGEDEATGVGRDPFLAKLLFIEKRSTPKSIARNALDVMLPLDIAGEDTWIDNFGEGANVSVEIMLGSPNKEKLIKANGVNMGDDAEDSEQFYDKRAECAWRMRMWIKGGGEIADLPKWKDELLSLRYRRTAGKISKIQLMPKMTMKKLQLNHGKSPNKVDGLMLSFYEADEVTKPAPPRVKKEPQTIYGG